MRNRRAKLLAVAVFAVWGMVSFGQAPLPDLVVSEITVSPPTFGAGELVTFRATVENRGDGPVTSGFTVSFFADDQAVGNVRLHPPLASGSQRSAIVLWVATGSPLTVRAEVDVRREIDEANEGNNGLERSLSDSTGAAEWTELYAEDFEDGQAQGWQLAEGDWEVVEDTDGNRVLRGREHNWARYTEESWGDFAFKLRVKLIRGSVHLNYRVSGCKRYFIGFHEEGIYLNKTSPCDRHIDLVQRSAYHRRGQWHAVEIKGQGGQIEIFVNGQRLIRYSDPDPLTYGSIALETLDDSEVYLDDLEVWGPRLPTVDLSWTRTGGPLGGLGYDVRMHPEDPDRMYVTDAWAGVFKSNDSGQTWFASNEGIITRAGPSGDAIPIFSLTVDPHTPRIIWAGTQNARGIFKSTDGGQTWEERVEGIVERNGISFRGFAVDPRSSEIVYAAAEISSFVWAGEERLGREFDLVEGVVYKTTDGGATWTPIWRGDNLARYVLIDPEDPDVLYVSTGIFDREAANSDADRNAPGGVGVLKSIDGGKTWQTLGRDAGLTNLYVGSLFMHPEDPDTLLAGAGNNAYGQGSGVFLSVDGGQSWAKTLATGMRPVTAVEFAAADPEIAYAGTAGAFYRSEDGGRSWQRRSGGLGAQQWGPPGVRAGVPIDIQVDPRDPDRLFVNNYGGGNFLSEDGGRSWVVASKGYTGAQLHDIAVASDDPDHVYTIGRSGLFRSLDGGENWEGLNYPPANFPEWYAVALAPGQPDHVLASDEHQGVLLRSTDGGKSWRTVYRQPQVRGGASGGRHGFKAISYALSEPSVVYAGMCSERRMLDERRAGASYGIYKSTNGGLSWKSVGDESVSRRNVNVIAVDPTDASVVYAGTYRGGVFKSVDGGQTWNGVNQGLPILDIRSLAINPQDPDVLYAGIEDGGIYKSTDGGESWRSSSGGLDPQAAVRALVVDPTAPNANVVYAGDLRTGVYRSEDGGNLWVSMNQGLNTRAVKELALSNGGERLYVATEGEGVFRLDLEEEE